MIQHQESVKESEVKRTEKDLCSRGYQKSNSFNLQPGYYRKKLTVDRLTRQSPMFVIEWAERGK